MSIPARSVSEITGQAITLLSKELGVVDTIRFLNQFSAGYGNYTEEREALFQDLTLEDVLREIKGEKGKKGT
jgi:hypothetical protein